MNLTRLILRLALIGPVCVSVWAQTAPVTPSPVVPDAAVPKPFQFDGRQFKLLLPNRPIILKPGGSLSTALRAVPFNKPCAAARVVKPNPALDPQFAPHNSGAAPRPIETHSRDISEMNVPAPSCADPAAAAPPPATPEKR